MQGAFVLAYPAANAEIEIHKRALDLVGPALGFDLNCLELYGLVGCGAVFFAHDALDALCIGDTAVLVNIGKAYFSTFLFPLGKLSDGSCGTYLTAQGTVVLTVADVKVEPWGPDSLEACLEQRWLKSISEADLHTFSAANTTAKELLL